MLTGLSSGDILLIVLFVVGAIVAGLYFLNRWAAKKMAGQEELIEKSRQTVSIYVIDKKKAKASEGNLPKAITENLPKTYKFLKLHLVKAKVGPQILTLISDKKVFNALPVKKTVKVDLAGLYIVDMKGMKSPKEMKEKAAAKQGGKKPWYSFLTK